MRIRTVNDLLQEIQNHVENCQNINCFLCEFLMGIDTVYEDKSDNLYDYFLNCCLEKSKIIYTACLAILENKR